MKLTKMLTSADFMARSSKKLKRTFQTEKGLFLSETKNIKVIPFGRINVFHRSRTVPKLQWNGTFSVKKRIFQRLNLKLSPNTSISVETQNPKPGRTVKSWTCLFMRANLTVWRNEVFVCPAHLGLANLLMGGAIVVTWQGRDMGEGVPFGGLVDQMGHYTPVHYVPWKQFI